MRGGNIYNNFEFLLYEKNIKGEVVEVRYQGIYVMVDDGYLAWSCAIPLVRNGTTYEVVQFSDWLESMRKDDECAFGILKGCFAILMYGLWFASIIKCDQGWLTWCALHNMLLHIDGLNKDWDSCVPSNWNVIDE